jgi:hypothetical protein
MKTLALNIEKEILPDNAPYLAAYKHTRKIINYFQPERKPLRSQKYTYFRSPETPGKESHLGFLFQTIWEANLT